MKKKTKMLAGKLELNPELKRLATVGSEFSDEASIHKVQFFKGLAHFQL